VWIFAVSYLFSATQASLTETLLTKRDTQFIGWAVTVCYVVSQTIFYLWLVITYPGNFDTYRSEAAYLNWVYGEGKRLGTARGIFYSILALVGVLTMIFSIFKIYHSAHLLSQTNSNLKFNKKAMVVHSILITLQIIVALGYCLQFLAKNATEPVYITLLAFETLA
jgi:hypothetical protein